MKLAFPITFPVGTKFDTYKSVTAGTTLYTLCRERFDMWVFRINGMELGRDRYRIDLAERFGFILAVK